MWIGIATLSRPFFVQTIVFKVLKTQGKRMENRYFKKLG